jgi:hypothetical protein
MRHEATGTDDPSTVQIFRHQGRGNLVVSRRDVKRFILANIRGAMRRINRAEAMIERGLQGGGVVGCKVADRAETAVFDAHWLVIGEQQHRAHHDHAAVVSAVHVVPPSVLM